MSLNIGIGYFILKTFYLKFIIIKFGIMIKFDLCNFMHWIWENIDLLVIICQFNNKNENNLNYYYR